VFLLILNDLRFSCSVPFALAFATFTHTGRHTFGTYLINNGVSIEAIPKIMGHTNMKQSLLYARMLGVTAINEMKTKLLKNTKVEEENEKDD